MRKLLGVLRQELEFIATTPALLLLLFLAPIAYPFLYSYVYVNKFERDVPIAICDLDNSQQSRAFIRALDATETVRIIGVSSDPALSKAAVEKGVAEGSIVIAQGFERDLIRSARPVIRAYINATRFMPVSDIGKGISDAIMSTGGDLLMHSFAAKGISRESARRYAEPIILQSRSIANTSNSYGDFIIPSILLLILQQTLFAGAAISAAGMQRKTRSAPPGVSLVVWFIGKAIPYFALYGAYAALLFTVHFRIWQIPFAGNAAILATLVALHFSIVIAVGFFIGSLCRSHLTALFLCLLSTYPIFLLSGIPWPIGCMPVFFQVVSSMLPSTHFISAAFAAARLDAGWVEVRHPVAALLIAAIIVIPLLLARMKLQEKKFRRN